MSEERAEKDFRTIDNLINNMGFETDMVAKKLAKTHPTLQQKFMGLAMAFIKEEAEEAYPDGRNEKTVEVAKKIKENLDEGDFYFPYI